MGNVKGNLKAIVENSESELSYLAKKDISDSDETILINLLEDREKEKEKSFNIDKTILSTVPDEIINNNAEAETVILFGKYRIEKLLGEGGMGKVYLCTNIKLGNLWAIKHIQNKNDSFKGLMAEEDILKKLNHVFLPKIVDIYHNANGTYIVESYIEGIPLNKLLLEKKFFAEETIIEWGKQLCEVLNYLHNMKPHPIIYRDMKPSNIIITEDNKPVIIDFGISKEYIDKNTKDNVIVTTLKYAAPEVLNSRYSDNRTDIYNLGSTLYKLITGKAFQNRKIAFKDSLNNNISMEIKNILLKCLEENMQDRYQNIKELKEDFENIVNIKAARVKKKNNKKKAMIFGVIVCIIILCITVDIIINNKDINKQVVLKQNKQEQIKKNYKKEEMQKAAKVALAKKNEDAKKKEEMAKAALAKKNEETKRKEEMAKAALAKKNEETKRKEEMAKAALAKKNEDAKKKEEMAKVALVKKNEDAKRKEEMAKAALAKKNEDAKRKEEMAKAALAKKNEDAKRKEEMAKAALAKKNEDAKKKEEMAKVALAKKNEDAKKKEEINISNAKVMSFYNYKTSSYLRVYGTVQFPKNNSNNMFSVHFNLYNKNGEKINNSSNACKTKNINRISNTTQPIKFDMIILGEYLKNGKNINDVSKIEMTFYNCKNNGKEYKFDTEKILNIK